MELSKAILTRRSVRNFRKGNIPDDKIRELIKAAIYAPSAGNCQPWHFYVVKDLCVRKRVYQEACRQEFLTEAPVFIIVCGHHDEAWHRPADGKDHTDVDVAIATEHICLTATTLGLGTCWVCNFDPAVLREALALPEGVEPVAIIPLGYPGYDDKAPARVRKQLDEIVQWGVKKD